MNYTRLTHSYLYTAIWSSNCMLPVAEDELIDGCMDVPEDHPLHGINEEYPLDNYFGVEDFTPEAFDKAKSDVIAFIETLDHKGLLEKALDHQDSDHIVYDFFLDRCGHGAGAWDRGYPGGIGDEIADIARDEFGECYVYINEDGSLGLE